MAGWVDAFLTPYPIPAWSKHLKGMSKLLSVLMFVPTVLPIKGMTSPLPYYRIHTFEVEGREHRGRPFAFALQAACESVPGFVEPGQLSRAS